ncbi:GNAT family N-acetyltransferase [Pantanalinema sp. GBBB05]|uniref:GNAT family N-acetyltransferase n=1 Tax=Pantanalinema sp. GBBB05 TaxID=2604139 RepID=UPI001D9C0482|nr:GNAT family N-acetyltransferase [Pantanalinema sp. GBBB05]
MTALLLPPFTARAYRGEIDLPAIVELINTCNVIDQLDHVVTIAELQNDLDNPDPDPVDELRLWTNAEGQLIGYSRLRVLPATTTAQEGFFNIKVHPEARYQGVEDQILAWAESTLRDLSRSLPVPLYLRTGARDIQTEQITWLEQHGFSVVRCFYRMTRSLVDPIPAPQFPTGFTVRSLLPEEVPVWVEMFNQTFIDHWNHHPMTVERRQRWLTHPTYDPELDQVAIAPDGTFAAFCFSLIDQEDNRWTGRLDGWIGDLGTRRGFRRLGLGRAMLLTGMHQLKAKGMDTALLGVDAENPSGALKLYESEGFRQQWSNFAYCKEL